jgi:hypothetical protein
LTPAAAIGYKPTVTPGFTVIDLTPQCEVRLEARYQYELLEQIEGASELIATFSSHLWRCPVEFELAPLYPGGAVSFRWRASAPHSAGIASLREPGQGRTLSVSLLAAGIDSQADQLTIEAFQNHLVRELRDTPFEPSFALSGLAQRPLLATVGLFVPEHPHDKLCFALADRCFAASFFRKLGLA